MTSLTSRIRLTVALIVVLSALLAVGNSTKILFETVQTALIPFDTDEADHANAGIELYYALVDASPTRISESIQRQAFYPPVHSFFVAASYLVSGVGIPQSRLPSVLLYILSALSLSIASFRVVKFHCVGSSAKYIAASLPLVCFASSPLVIQNSALSMLELCGVFFTSFLCLVMTYQSSWHMPLAISLLIMFTKYSFGILALPGVLFGYLINGSKPFIHRNSIITYAKILAGFLLIFGAWCLYSDREAIFHFFVGHPSYAPLLSAENLLFEVRAWLFEYNQNLYFAALLLASALFGAISLWKLLSVRIASGIILSSLCILALSTTNESRHFIIAAPTLWFLASIGVGRAWSLRQSIAAPIVALPAFAFILYGTFTLQSELPRHIINEMEGKPEFNDLQEALFSAIDCSQPVLLIGVSDQFGIEALRWRGAATCKLPYTKIRFDSFPYRDDKNRTAKKRMRNLDRPYTNDGFPKDPIDTVLSTGYYHSLVLIRDIGARGATPSLVKELKDRFSGLRLVQINRGGKEITIIPLG